MEATRGQSSGVIREASPEPRVYSNLLIRRFWTAQNFTGRFGQFPHGIN